ncbi:MAG TPA: MOSC domain-containing protein [Cytophagales bacterium]|nr:MOSC domain-containing protein [Cytophagales bacterium]
MNLNPESPLQKLMDTLPQQGKVCWIGIRPARGEDLVSLQQVEALQNKGLKDDHYSKKLLPGKRQVTLIQQEHLHAVASIMQTDLLSPNLFRRNIVVSGINLLSLKGKTFRVGTALLEYTGECHPCSRMEQNLGAGGYNAMRGHGGITARIVEGGMIQVNDLVLSSLQK